MSSSTATTVQMKYVEIGAMIAMVLFGVSTVQVYIYLCECRSDPRWTKSFVVVIWMLEFAHTLLSGHTIYILTALDFNSSRTVMDIGRINDLSGLIAAGISSFSQAYFSFRLYQLSKSIWLPAVCWAISAIKLVSFYIVVIHDISGGRMGGIWGALLLVPAVLSWTSDLLVAAGLLWCVWIRCKERKECKECKERKDRGDRRDRKECKECKDRKERQGRIIESTIVDTILLWCLETNMLTCLSSSLTFTFYTLNRGNWGNWLWIPLALVTCRSYSMCIFASLIGKRGLKDRWMNCANPELAMHNNDLHSFLQGVPTVASRAE
ncbi:hypothetical protein P691DRAFT_802678 [Macrolepiota fuliginosa MF-IS2]|uniref:Transmembrane protein n=1 Tax=Macrolepiota fuliginosa MF-IS2 TaxID=1400762 RepID=A0A9P6C126_9AGAR|nr:hypothetical protein P691DRAFT_802678 [Macrolepiota fuliginosa MF-IS2]